MTPFTGKLLGIDHGSKVIGVASSDTRRMLAFPLTRILRTTREKDFAALKRIIQEQGAVGIVIGDPQTDAAFSGQSQAITSRNWAARLVGQIAIPVYLWEETLTTSEAHDLVREHGLTNRARVDDIAAALILQSFLDAHRNGEPYPEPVPRARH